MKKLILLSFAVSTRAYSFDVRTPEFDPAYFAFLAQKYQAPTNKKSVAQKLQPPVVRQQKEQQKAVALPAVKQNDANLESRVEALEKKVNTLQERYSTNFLNSAKTQK